ncbi:uncharacterized protein DUF4412 [Algoriphagus boseongensis]|uniref:Uncharacterized protein DUF4412 n=1 Tax=Algoriphagus boseongensis TaxID=1442587 RepID=A0A4R6T912_9BACT|nr:DUF4412 domain-containing protein [Algoriphagus boseongensis]TDQ18663.1 uncharacterized protein DUF4412 [Algoriphagus boseongensis]
MKKSILGLLVLAAVSFSTTAQAQLLKKIQNAAQNAATNAASSKAEKESSDKMGDLIGGMMQPAPTESAYQFTGYMVMEVTATDKKGKSDPPSRINYLLGDNVEFMGMSFSDPKTPQNTTTTIMDTKNQAMVMLLDNEGQKSSMAMKMDYDKIQDMVDEEASDQMKTEDYQITKTGNTKDILGYPCEEFLVKTEDGEGRYWVTKEPIKGFSMFSPQSNPMVSNKTVERYNSFFSNAPKGTFLEMIFTSTDGSVTDMKVVEIELNSPLKFTMSEYPNMMSGMN